jgi:septal ring factor EnvC (AmiA/AmiB activator)
VRAHHPRRWQRLCSAAALALPLAVHAAPRDDLDALRGRIERLQRELARSEDNRTDAADALRESERAISAANRRLAQLAQERAQLASALTGMQDEERNLAARIERQRQELTDLLRTAYERGGAASLPVLLSGEEPGKVARTLHYLGYVYRAHAQRLEGLRRDLGELDAVSGKTRAQAAELEQLEAQRAAERAALERQRAARDTTLARVSKDIQRQRREIGTLRRDEARLARLVQRLAEELAARSAAKRARGRAADRPGEVAAVGEFGRLKGRLRVPVQGELASRFGSPRQDTGVPWNGVFITTAPRAPVQAVAAGRVVFSDWLRGYGNLLIIDHGDGWMTLYANNETLLRQVGETVSAGEPIAAAGDSGGNPQTGLYFEVRFRGRPQDPLLWVKAR